MRLYQVVEEEDVHKPRVREVLRKELLVADLLKLVVLLRLQTLARMLIKESSSDKSQLAMVRPVVVRRHLVSNKQLLKE